MSNKHSINPDLAALQVKYVSLPPGAGKTTAAIEMMRQHLTGDLKLAKTPKYIFYVAATVELLNQTAQRLQKAVRSKKLRSKIRIAYHDPKDKDRLSVQQQVPNILGGRTNDGKSSQPFTSGSILFITHEAFLMLSQSYNRMYAHTLVVFDEARKWADMESPIVMDDGAVEFFDKLFIVKPKGRAHAVGCISEIEATKFPENKKVEALQGCGKKAARSFKALDELHTALSRHPDAPMRMRVYAFFEKGKGNSAGSTILIQVKLPSFPFIGFLDVFILSADFTTSQMFYFFEDEGTRVLNNSQWFMDTFHPDGYKKVVRRATERYDYVDIVALNTDPEPPAISKYKMGGLMIPRSRLVKLGDLMADLDLSGGDALKAINRVRHPLKYTPSSDDKRLVSALRKMGAQTDMLKWFVAASHRVVRAWRKRNPSSKPALMFLNKDFKDKMDVDPSLFHQLNHAETVGDNRWHESNAVVFLAAINPKPKLDILLRARLGHLGYDPKEDFIVDKVIQATGRGNIRTHGIKNRMLIVVPTEGLAQRVGARLNERSTYHSNVTERLGNLVSWNNNMFASMSLEEDDPEKAARLARRRAPKREKRKMTSSEKLKERSLYKAAYRAKEAGDLKTYSKLESQRDALRFVVPRSLK